MQNILSLCVHLLIIFLKGIVCFMVVVNGEYLRMESIFF